ncbi:MAG: SAM-dependent methyltransferase, partial [Chloroflexota bacterium]
GRLHELYVGWRDGRFVEVPGELSDERIAPRLEVDGGELAEGQRTEVNLRMAEWLARIADDLEHGYVLLIDYGLSGKELRSAARATGTIRAFRGQHVSSDVLGGVGHQDITAHVDLDALDGDARQAGLAVLGRTTQAEFLMGCGFEEIYQDAKKEADRDWESALGLRSAVRRLLDPHHLGGYAVVVLGKGVEESAPALRGLAYHLDRPA